MYAMSVRIVISSYLHTYIYVIRKYIWLCMHVFIYFFIVIYIYVYVYIREPKLVK